MREARRNYARGKLVRLCQAKVHLLVESALARGELGGRLGGQLFRKLKGCPFQVGGRHDTIDKAPFERAPRVDGLAGEQHLERVLAKQVSPDGDAWRGAEKAPAHAG